MIQNKTLTKVLEMAKFDEHSKINTFAIIYDLGHIIESMSKTAGIRKKQEALLKYLVSADEKIKIKIIQDLVEQELKSISSYDLEEFAVQYPDLAKMLKADGFVINGATLVFQAAGSVIYEPENANELVKKLLDQINTLLKEHDYSAVIDRAHTSMHGYMVMLCKEAQIEHRLPNNENIKIQDYWSVIKSYHPKFEIDQENRTSVINQMMNAVAKILDKFNEARNKNSFAHPNEVILENEEAKLLLNLCKSILQYMQDKSLGN